MLHETDKPKRSEFNLHEHFSALERDWLSGFLVTNTGVIAAVYGDRDPHQLFIEFDSQLMSAPDLLDILYRRGLRADLRAADCPDSGTTSGGKSARVKSSSVHNSQR
jgi:hypothetical protein